LSVTTKSSYLICASARTGSNLLTSTLRDSTLAGRPFEYFGLATLNKPHMVGLLKLSPDTAPQLDLASRLDRILEVATTKNGIFGATLHWGHLQPLLAAIVQRMGKNAPFPGRAPAVLQAFFPNLKFVWLRRENHVAQGISHYLAQKTGRWQTRVRDAAPDDLQENTPPFDFARIKRLVTHAAQEEDGWRSFFAGMTDNVLSLTYEELAADHAATTGRVLEFIGLPDGAVSVPPAPLKRQATALSREWEQRFRSQDDALEHSMIIGSLRAAAGR